MRKNVDLENKNRAGLSVSCAVLTDQVQVVRNELIYGHFIEHFHRQIYGGVYDPESRFADEDGFRTDVLEAMRRIRVPILRWPGGCFVSSYHWKKAVGPVRTPFFDKAWRVEDPNSFGTDEYVRLCRKIGCEPYICTNAGTGSAEEMSDWLEYCNLKSEGEFAKLRIANGFPEPYQVHFWSIGNENYGFWEIGAKDADEWSRLVLEAAKMMKHVDPAAQLSAAALTDTDWNVKLLKEAGEHLDWISIHSYWNLMANDNTFADYRQSMAYTADLERDIRRVRGLLMAFGLEKKIKIAFDEWNLRGWHHPGVHTVLQSEDPQYYIKARDLNDRNQDYTMADAVFTACFLNTLNRNADIVGMANFAPVVNTRGCIFTFENGIVLRGTYLVFDLYVNYLGDEILESRISVSSGNIRMQVKSKDGADTEVDALDLLATRHGENGMLAIAAVNKHPEESILLELAMASLTEQKMSFREYRIITVNGDSTESYNDIGHTGITLKEGEWQKLAGSTAGAVLQPHSVNVIQIR